MNKELEKRDGQVAGDRSRIIGTLPALLFALLAFLNAGADHAHSGNFPSHHVKVEVEDISYEGADSYRIEISLHNASDRTYVIKKVESSFYTQLEVLGQWKLLEQTTELDFTGKGGFLPAKGKKQIVSVVRMPLNIPRLYRNFEGDINVMMKYDLDFTVDSGGPVISNAGESSYWIKPLTDKWLLREGM